MGTELARTARAWKSMPSTEPGIEAKPRLLTGCCAYSYSKPLKAGKMSMEDVIGKAVELGPVHGHQSRGGGVEPAGLEPGQVLQGAHALGPLDLHVRRDVHSRRGDREGPA